MHFPRKPLLRMQWRISCVKIKCLYSLRMAVCLVTLQGMQELNTISTAAILLDQAGNEAPVSDEKIYAAHSPSPSISRRSSTLSPGAAMSSTAQPTFSTSTIQSINDALTDYTKVTGIDLSKTSFATATEHFTSPDDILKLFQERAKAFREYRDKNQRLINCLRPVVTAIQAFSGIIGEEVSLVSYTCHPRSSFNDFSRFRFLQQKPCSRGSILSFLYVPRIRLSTESRVTNEYASSLVESHSVMMLFSSCSSVWGTSSGAWKSIRQFRPLRY